jgi:hypothetical protein
VLSPADLHLALDHRRGDNADVAGDDALAAVLRCAGGATLDRRRFMAMAAAPLAVARDEYIHAAFRSLDRHCSGVLSAADIHKVRVCVRVCACVRVCVCVMPARLSVFQALPHVKLSAIRSMVAAVDGDGDGCINATEFARLVRGDGMDGAADSGPACSSCSSGRDGLQPSESCGRGLSPHTAAHTAAPMPHSSLCVGETRCQCQCRSQCQRHCQCGSDSAAGSDVRDVGAGHSSEPHDRGSIVSEHRDKRVCTRRSVSPADSACGKH